MLLKSQYRKTLGLLEVKLNLPKGSITPHTGRISSATTAAKAGASQSELKAMGNWNSDKTADAYVRLKLRDLNSVHAKMAKALQGEEIHLTGDTFGASGS